MNRKHPPSWLTTIVIIYASGTIVWIGFWLFHDDPDWWLILLNHFGSLPLLLMLPLGCIVNCHWRLVSLLLPALIFLFALFGAYWRPTISPETQPDLIVMSYNVLYSNDDFAAVESILRTYQPDLVALQEVGPELFAYLQTNLADRYVAFHKADDPDHSTTAILSRYPLQNVAIVDLGAIRPAVVADLRVGEQTVTFISAHLLYYGWLRLPWAEFPTKTKEVHHLQNQQAQFLVAELERRATDIVILGCDCNSVDTSTTQVYLNRHFTNAAKASGWVLPQPQFPRLGPFYFPQRVDYIFYRGGLIPQGTYTIYVSGGSDHFPVIGYFVGVMNGLTQ